MKSKRLEQLKKMLEDNPQDPFLLYALAQEFLNNNETDKALKWFKDLIEKIGVKRRIFTAGENKSFLDPFVDVQDKDVEKLIKVQTSIFKNFKALVLKNRKEKIEADKVCNGEFWTGEQAIDLGLVDSNDALVDYLDNNYGKNYRLRPIESKKSFLKGIFSSRSNATDSISGLVETLYEEAHWSRYGR